MPITSTSFNDIGNSGQVPSLVRIETDDSLSAVLTVGYLNALAHQNLPLSETSVVLVSTGVGVNKAVTAMRMVFSGGDWSLELLEGYQASGGGGSGVLQSVSVPVTSAQFKDLDANPILIAASPGAGKLIVGYSFVVEILYGTTQYADGSGVFLSYGNGDAMTAGIISDSMSAAIFNFVTSDTIVSTRMYVYGTEYYYDASLGVNMGAYLRVNSPDFTTGDSNLVVHFSYQVLDVTAT